MYGKTQNIFQQFKMVNIKMQYIGCTTKYMYMLTKINDTY